MQWYNHFGGQQELHRLGCEAGVTDGGRRGALKKVMGRGHLDLWSGAKWYSFCGDQAPFVPSCKCCGAGDKELLGDVSQDLQATPALTHNALLHCQRSPAELRLPHKRDAVHQMVLSRCVPHHRGCRQPLRGLCPRALLCRIGSNRTGGRGSIKAGWAPCRPGVECHLFCVTCCC